MKIGQCSHGMCRRGLEEIARTIGISAFYLHLEKRKERSRATAVVWLFPSGKGRGVSTTQYWGVYHPLLWVAWHLQPVGSVAMWSPPPPAPVWVQDLVAFAGSVLLLGCFKQIVQVGKVTSSVQLQFSRWRMKGLFNPSIASILWHSETTAFSPAQILGA